MAHVASVEFEFIGDLKPEKVWGKWVNNIDPKQNGGYQLQGEFAHTTAKDPRDMSKGCTLTFPDIPLEKGLMYWSISYTTGSVNKATAGANGVLNIGGVTKYRAGFAQAHAEFDLAPSAVTSVTNTLRWSSLENETVGVFYATDNKHLRKCIDLMLHMESTGEAKFDSSYYTSLNNQPIKQTRWNKVAAALESVPASQRQALINGSWDEARDTNRSEPILRLSKVCDLPSKCILRRDSYGRHFVEYTGATGPLRNTQILYPLSEYLTNLSREDEQRIKGNYDMRTCMQKALFEENALAAQTARQTRLLFPLYLTEKPDDDDEDSPF